MATIRTRIASLTAEIAQWLPEFGEDALMALYEERARWGEMMMKEMHHAHKDGKASVTPP